MKKIIVTDKAPLPFGLYSQAVIAGDFLYISGQLPVDPKTSELVSNDPRDQIKQCLLNLKNICEASGFNLNQAVKINVYYTDLAVTNALDSIMKEYFTEPYAARIRVKVAGLSRNALVEMDGVFYDKC